MNLFREKNYCLNMVTSGGPLIINRRVTDCNRLHAKLHSTCLKLVDRSMYPYTNRSAYPHRMSSIQILQEYLLARSSLKQVMSKVKFEKEVTRIHKKIDATTVESLYDALVLQRSKSLKKLKQSIVSEFSDFGDERAIVHEVEANTLNGLILQMETVDKTLEQEETIFERDCSEQLAEMDRLIEGLSDLKYGKTTFEEAIDEAIESLDSLSGNILASVLQQ